ncbi:hypothetical protein F5I97DRAFT_587543 [Phlebopus sp. FC_14]|nr:hypothetical protein F5I97DRAFT_587543 [Phlebopus sp. FC_14]
MCVETWQYCRSLYRFHRLVQKKNLRATMLTPEFWFLSSRIFLTVDLGCFQVSRSHELSGLHMLSNPRLHPLSHRPINVTPYMVLGLAGLTCTPQEARSGTLPSEPHQRLAACDVVGLCLLRVIHNHISQVSLGERRECQSREFCFRRLALDTRRFKRGR